MMPHAVTLKQVALFSLPSVFFTGVALALDRLLWDRTNPTLSERLERALVRFVEQSQELKADEKATTVPPSPTKADRSLTPETVDLRLSTYGGVVVPVSYRFLETLDTDQAYTLLEASYELSLSRWEAGRDDVARLLMEACRIKLAWHMMNSIVKYPSSRDARRVDTFFQVAATKHTLLDGVQRMLEIPHDCEKHKAICSAVLDAARQSRLFGGLLLPPSDNTTSVSVEVRAVTRIALVLRRSLIYMRDRENRQVAKGLLRVYAAWYRALEVALSPRVAQIPTSYLRNIVHIASGVSTVWAPSIVVVGFSWFGYEALRRALQSGDWASPLLAFPKLDDVELPPVTRLGPLSFPSAVVRRGFIACVAAIMHAALDKTVESLSYSIKEQLTAGPGCRALIQMVTTTHNPKQLDEVPLIASDALNGVRWNLLESEIQLFHHINRWRQFLLTRPRAEYARLVPLIGFVALTCGKLEQMLDVAMGWSPIETKTLWAVEVSEARNVAAEDMPLDSERGASAGNTAAYRAAFETDIICDEGAAVATWGIATLTAVVLDRPQAQTSALIQLTAFQYPFPLQWPSVPHQAAVNFEPAVRQWVTALQARVNPGTRQQLKRQLRLHRDQIARAATATHEHAAQTAPQQRGTLRLRQLASVFPGELSIDTPKIHEALRGEGIDVPVMRLARPANRRRQQERFTWAVSHISYKLRSRIVAGWVRHAAVLGFGFNNAFLAFSRDATQVPNDLISVRRQLKDIGDDTLTMFFRGIDHPGTSWSSWSEPGRSIEYWQSAVDDETRWLVNAVIRQSAEAVPSISTPAVSELLRDGSLCITFDDVWFSYPSDPTRFVLKGVSFTVSPGQTLAIAGETGCGKSTIVQLLLKVYVPTRGRIVVNGVDLNDVPSRWWRRRVATVAQKNAVLLPDRNLSDSLRLAALSASPAEIDRALEAASVKDVAKKLGGLQAVVDPDSLSGGERQRFALAQAQLRCAVGATPLVIFDEATSALDVETERRLYKTIASRSSATTVAVAHRLFTVKHADMVVVMGPDGRVIETGSFAALSEQKDSKLSGLIRLQQLAMPESGHAQAATSAFDKDSDAEPSHDDDDDSDDVEKALKDLEVTVRHSPLRESAISSLSRLRVLLQQRIAA